MNYLFILGLIVPILVFIGAFIDHNQYKKMQSIPRTLIYTKCDGNSMSAKYKYPSGKARRDQTGYTLFYEEIDGSLKAIPNVCSFSALNK